MQQRDNNHKSTLLKVSFLKFHTEGITNDSIEIEGGGDQIKTRFQANLTRLSSQAGHKPNHKPNAFTKTNNKACLNSKSHQVKLLLDKASNSINFLELKSIRV